MMTNRRLWRPKFLENERCDFITSSHRSVYITTWQIFRLLAL